MRRIMLRGCASVVALVVLYNTLALTGALDTDIWKRESPLASPITVTSVKDGQLTLADGRTLRPAGVERAPGVSAANYDRALVVMVAQGVQIDRDLGDGQAFLRGEPKFYNSCGTRYHRGISWLRWGGSYLQSPLSELLVGSGYARITVDEPGLTARERWRLEGIERLCPIPETPTRIADDVKAFRYGGIESSFENYEEMLELVWKPGPP